MVSAWGSWDRFPMCCHLPRALSKPGDPGAVVGSRSVDGTGALSRGTYRNLYPANPAPARTTTAVVSHAIRRPRPRLEAGPRPPRRRPAGGPAGGPLGARRSVMVSSASSGRAAAPSWSVSGSWGTNQVPACGPLPGPGTRWAPRPGATAGDLPPGGGQDG
jgi:hypothetical protein